MVAGPRAQLRPTTAAPDPQLGALAVVGDGLDLVGPGVDDVAVERLDQVRPVQDDFGHVGAGLEMPPTLELEEVAFGADDGTLGEPLEQSEGLRLARSASLHAWIASWLAKM